MIFDTRGIASICLSKVMYGPSIYDIDTEGGGPTNSKSQCWVMVVLASGKYDK